MEGSRDERRQLDSPDGRGERRLREFTQGKLTEILERMTEEFFAVDCEWRYTYLNQRALRRIQQAKDEDLTREDLLGKSVWEVCPEQVDSVFYEKYHEALREQETVEFEA